MRSTRNSHLEFWPQCLRASLYRRRSNGLHSRKYSREIVRISPLFLLIALNTQSESVISKAAILPSRLCLIVLARLMKLNTSHCSCPRATLRNGRDIHDWKTRLRECSRRSSGHKVSSWYSNCIPLRPLAMRIIMSMVSEHRSL